MSKNRCPRWNCNFPTAPNCVYCEYHLRREKCDGFDDTCQDSVGHAGPCKITLPDTVKPMRTDQKKVMMQLNSPIADAGTAAIFTKSATGKYKPHDWRKGGLPWTARVASLKRHIALFEAGIDIDRCLPECPSSCIQHTNLPHVDCIGANAVMLQEFFRTTRGDDDRYTLSEEAQIELQRIIEGSSSSEVRTIDEGAVQHTQGRAKKA